MNADTLSRAVVKVEALYSGEADEDALAQQCQLVREDALTLDVENVGHYTLMWTPTGALDMAIGLALLSRGGVAGCGAVLSSRLSLEMVVKAVRTDLEIVLAVSAPTSLAVDVARHFGVTLCGFVRDERATLYSHPHRIR